jgi:L,D-transpeptidase YcbB
MSCRPCTLARLPAGSQCTSLGSCRPASQRSVWARAGLLLLLLACGTAMADLRATLSPFAHTKQPEIDPPVLALGEREIPLYSPRLLAELYAERDYRPAWDARRAEALLELARASRGDGFNPDDFHVEAIAAILDSGDLQSVDAARRDTAELLLSDALLRYVHHFRFGKHNPERLNRGWTFQEDADADQLQADLARALAAADLSAELDALLPNPDFYRNLKKGYQRYLAIADRGGWQDIPGGPNLNVGAKDPRVPLIREHLEVSDGYAPGFVAEPELYDEDLAEAIKGFQRRSGLAADGVVGPNTLRALNFPLQDRLLAIRANLERMRWLYNDLPNDYVFVDLTAFELYLVRNDEEVWRTKGIIGTVENQTPMFRDEIEHLVFNPTWTLPESIAKKYRGVPSGYTRVRSGGRYYLVQQPGPRNALGRVKFMFPNGHAIYLHDTPSRHLFGRAQRAYSHGCIRVHQPLTLAQHVLNKPAWDDAEINRVVRRGRTRYVHMDEHLTVLLYYLTAKADAEGRVGFRRDIYNRDRRLLAALDQPVDSGAERIAFVEPEPEPEPEPVLDAPAEAADGEVVAATDAADDTAAGAADPVTGVEPTASVPAHSGEVIAASGDGGESAPATGPADALPQAEATAETGAEAAEAEPEAEAEAETETEAVTETAATESFPGADAAQAESPGRAASELTEAAEGAAADATAAAEAASGAVGGSAAASEPAIVADDAPVAEGPTDAPEPAAAGAEPEADGATEEQPADAEVSLPSASHTGLGAAPAQALSLDADGRFADRPSRVGNVAADAAGRPKPAHLDLSVSPSRIAAPAGPDAGSDSAGNAYPPVIRASRIADEPPLWILPGDE